MAVEESRRDEGMSGRQDNVHSADISTRRVGCEMSPSFAIRGRINRAAAIYPQAEIGALGATSVLQLLENRRRSRRHRKTYMKIPTFTP
ncbi:MAG TPA: hypothetical protein VHZ29_02490 [Rhizomicrobium sp.]|nr:hypothetical protein [Rhizomicrobium sp.]